MFHWLLLGIFLVFGSAPEKDWESWKDTAYEKALNSPTSFLNAISLEQAVSGQSLYLVLGKTSRSTLWLTGEPKEFYAQAEHIGSKIRVKVKGQTQFYLQNKKGSRRKQLTLDNGLIAEVVFGKRAGKMWTYLYNPKQIKKFSGFRFYPFNEKAITQGLFKKHKARFVSYKTVQGDPTQVNQVGNISFMLQGKEFFLPAYNWQPSSENLKYLAVVYSDNTGGSETYGGGRELVIELPQGIKDGMTFSMDFNRSMNFYCAHSPFWHCPVGLQKKLPLAVKAGEMLPLRKIVQ